MIHHCEIVAAPRGTRATPPRHRSPNRGRPGSVWVAVTAAVVLVSFAATLGAQQPAQQPAQRPGSAAPAAAAAPPARNISWTSDKRTFAVGDIIKVVVDEYALARANKDNRNSASRRRSMTLGIEPPSTGSAPAMGDINGSVGTGDAGESRQQGQATRDTRYVGEIPVRVVAVTPEGLLRVQGSKTIDVDKNKQTLTLSGLVRPIDIAASDVVSSELVADAQISYQSKGSLGKPRNGILTKIVGIFWP